MSNPPQSDAFAERRRPVTQIRYFSIHAVLPGRGDTESVRCRLIRPFDSLHSALKNVRKNTPHNAGCCMERMKGIAPHSQCECTARLGDDIFRARHFGVRAITPGRGDTESVRCRLIRPFDSLHSALKGVRKNTPRCAGCRVERMKGIEPSTAAWEAAVLPLNYIRIPCVLYFITTERFVNSMRVFRA